MHKRHIFYPTIAMLLAIGVFLISNIANALLMVPAFGIEGTVYNNKTNEKLKGVLIKIKSEWQTINIVTDNNGYYYKNNIDCPNNEAILLASLDGYKPFSATIPNPCWRLIQFDIYLEPETQAEPVIVIPGIMGSWNDKILNKSILEDEWKIDPIFDTYDYLLTNLQNAGDYTLNETLFTFPYDWRQDNRLTAELLKNKINEIKQQTGADKVDIIAHSMGGLIARYYIESDLYQNDVDQIIFIGTPHRGAPKAYLAWEGGYLGTNFPIDFIKEKIINQIAKINKFDSLIDYIKNYPITSLQQLLPDYPYLTDANTGDLIPYSPGNNKYPYNEFLIDLNNQNKIDLFTNRINESYIIYGDNLETITRYKVTSYPGDDLKWQHGYPEGFNSIFRKRGIIFGAGDKTVPTFSATDFPTVNKIRKYQTSHSQIVSDSVSDIIYILKNKQVVITPKEPYTDYLLVQVYSPIDIQIISPSGKKLGVDFTGNTEINEIDGAYYSGLGAKIEFALIPNPEKGEYELLTKGTGNGNFAIDVSLINDNGADTKKVKGNTIENSQIGFNLNLSTNKLQVEPEDKTPPQITITSPLPQSYLHSDVIDINYQVNDDGVGVWQTEKYLNNSLFESNNIDLFNYSLGDYQFKIKARDRVDNESEKVVSFKIIATFSSLKKDIERLFTEGDIKSKRTKNHIIKLIKKLENYKNKVDKKSQKRKYRHSKRPEKIAERTRKNRQKTDKTT